MANLLDGLFFSRWWRNGTKLIETPQDIEVIDPGGACIVSTVSGRTRLDFTGAGGGMGYGPFASRPVAGSAGRGYVATDSPIAFWIDDGSEWHPIVGGVVGQGVPSLTDFENTWTRYNDAANLDVLAANGALTIKGNNDSSTESRGWSVATSSGTASIEIAFSDQTLIARGSDTYVLCGVGFRESGTEKAVTVQLARTVSGTGTLNHSVHHNRWNNDSARTSHTEGTNERLFGIMNESGAPTFLRARRTATHVVCEVSRDRQLWTEVASYDIASAFTVAPNQLIITTDCINVSTNGTFQVTHLAVDP